MVFTEDEEALIVTRVDAGQVPIWSRRVILSEPDNLSGDVYTAPFEDGGCLIYATGRVELTGSADTPVVSTLHAVRLSAEAEVVYATTLVFPAPGNFDGLYMTPYVLSSPLATNAAGEVFLQMRTAEPEHPRDGLLKLDATGAPLWMIVQEGMGTIAGTILPDAFGGCYLVHKRDDPNTHVQVSHIGADGEVLWSRDHNGFGAPLFGRCEMQPAGEDSYFITGMRDGELWVVQVAEQGAVLSCRRIGTIPGLASGIQSGIFGFFRREDGLMSVQSAWPFGGQYTVLGSDGAWSSTFTTGSASPDIGAPRLHIDRPRMLGEEITLRSRYHMISPVTGLQEVHPGAVRFPFEPQEHCSFLPTIAEEIILPPSTISTFSIALFEDHPLPSVRPLEVEVQEQALPVLNGLCSFVVGEEDVAMTDEQPHLVNNVSVDGSPITLWSRGNGQVRIMDPSGRIVRTVPLKGASMMDLPVHDHRAGVYLVSVIDVHGGVVFTGKVTVL